MTTNCSPLIFDESIQRQEIMRLKEWIKLVSQRESQRPVVEGVAKFVELDLILYGSWPTVSGRQNAFGVLWESDEIQSFLDKRVWLENCIVGSLLDLFSQGLVLIIPGYRDGNADFIFIAARKAAKVTS